MMTNAHATPQDQAALPVITDLKRIVIKIGSSLLVDPAGQLRASWLATLVEDIAALQQRGVAVAVVTSGAVALGASSLGRAASPRSSPGQKAARLEDKQAAAALGQVPLITAYQTAFAQVGMTVGQILLTLTDTQQRRSHLNARATLNAVMDSDAVPIINENDTVTTQEIRYGDNDRLAAMVTQIIPADALIILSDVDGLYSHDPRLKKDTDPQHIPLVRAVTPAVMARASPPRPGYSRGGMATKLLAAQICLDAGCHMVIANGQIDHPLRPFLTPPARGGAADFRATWFVSQTTPKNARKRWLAGMIDLAGTLVIDAGAAKALHQGKSLLPAGLVAAAGTFSRGDCVDIVDEARQPLGRGLAMYNDQEMAQLAGRQSYEMENIVGYQGREELIHRDDLVLTSRPSDD